ncbi:MAG: aconitate hydratase B, partial [Betaproteobacteria bacterium]|nr:aconitate hydratase B [Betaproteobacteria bacterium]
MIDDYRKEAANRLNECLPPLPLTAKQTAELVTLLKSPDTKDTQTLLELFCHRVPSGVDQAAYIKAAYLTDIAKGIEQSKIISPKYAIELLGTMVGGYNVQSLISLLDSDLADDAVKVLSHIILIFDAFYDVSEKVKSGNKAAMKLMESWANGDWFLKKSVLPKEIKALVFKVDGETNTDDLSPAQEAWSRPDIPLHAKAMLVNKMPNGIKIIQDLKVKQLPIAYVGDVVGTGSSRKSAINSLQWHIGTDIPFIPNKRTGGIILGNKIAPIFFNTAEDSGALPIECDVSRMKTGDEITIQPFEGKILNSKNESIATFNLIPFTLADEYRAGGRIPLIIGRGLTSKAREFLKLSPSTLFLAPAPVASSKKGFTLAQKMVGRACGLPPGIGVRPGTYCEPKVTSVGSQDTTGAMTRDELKELACL